MRKALVSPLVNGQPLLMTSPASRRTGPVGEADTLGPAGAGIVLEDHP
jgi:hypothetical protein